MPDTTQFGSPDEPQNNGDLKVGTILLARYKIEGRIGGGGQGSVYQARDLNFPEARRLVAIKEMHVTASDPNLRASTMRTFRREANLLATLSHPAITKIYDFFDQNDRAYIVMEYINGRDLEQILTKTKTLPLDKIIEWAIELCDVLDYLHTHKPEPIVFRDMKPANIMIDSLGKVRLIDFGIAKVLEDNKPHTMIGTEGYSAPEQYKGKANPLSDIYSLGATLHHVITRADPRLEPPFSFSERTITDLNEEATPQLAQIIDKALEFESENRYQSCADMRTDFEALRYKAVPIGAAPTAVSTPAGTETASPGETTGFGDMAVGIEPRWTFRTEDEIYSSPAIFREFAFIGSYDTNIWALRLDTGELVWKRATEGGIATTPIIDPDYRQILFGSEDYTFSSLDYRDGRLNWSYTTGDKVRGTARLAHGHVFFGSDDGKLYALVANNGRYLWEYDSAAPIRSTPFVTEDRIIFGNEAGEVIGLELSGQRKWGFRTRRAVTSSPVVDSDNVCYVGSFDGFLYAIDAVNGYSQWRLRTNGPIISSPAVDGGYVYVGSADGKLYCINAQSGKERWTYNTGNPIVSSPRVFRDVVYFGGTEDQKLYALNARTGEELWTFEAGGQIVSRPLITQELILFGSLDKTLYALPLIS